MRADLVCGGIILVVVAAFAVQRDYGSPLAGTFPDVVLVTLTVLSGVIIVRGLRKGARQEEARRPRSIDLRMLAAACAVLVAWALGMGLVGFTISSVAAFVVMTSLIRRGRPQPKCLALDTALGIAVCVVFFLVFTRVLLVPLPVSTLIGM